MELAPFSVTGCTGQYRFHALFFQVALTTGKSHGGLGWTRMTRGAVLFHTPAPPVTLIAIELGVLSSHWPGMLEFPRHLHLGGCGNPCLLTDDGMAELAFVPDHLAFATHMFPVMAAEATWIQGMADIVRVSAPIHFHLRKEVGLVDPLDL